MILHPISPESRENSHYTDLSIQCNNKKKAYSSIEPRKNNPKYVYVHADIGYHNIKP